MKHIGKLRTMNKTDKAIGLLREGRLKEALAIIKTFRIDFTKEEHRTIEIAHESLVGHSSFYENIGIDTQLCISKTQEIVRNKYHIKQQEKWKRKRI